MINVVPFLLPDTGILNIEIQIDRSFLSTKEFNKELATTMKAVAEEGRRFWRTEAGRRLKTSFVPYTKNIKVEATRGKFEWELSNDGFFPYMIESGGYPFDMKPGFLRSPLAKTSLKIPKAKVKTLISAGPKATKFFIVPFPTARDGSRFRTVTDKSPAGSFWWRPRRISGGIKISEKVVEELQTKIIPRHMRKLMKTLKAKR